MSRGRGRPTFMLDNHIPTICALFPEIKTRRGQQNRAYALYALHILKNLADDNESFSTFGRLSDKNPQLNFKRLTALGRLCIFDDEIIIAVARKIEKDYRDRKDIEYVIQEYGKIVRKSISETVSENTRRFSKGEKRMQECRRPVN